MALDKLTYAAAKKYTDNSIAGGGAVRGKNCVITDISPITGGNRVTFQWTLDNGTVQQGTMDVMDGVDGQDGATGAQGPQGPAGADGQDGADGLGIKSVAVNAQGHLIITYDDDTTEDAGEIQVTAAVDSVNGKTGDVTLTASDVGALPDDTTIPSKISDLTNDSDFIEKSATAGLVKNDGTIDPKTYVEAETGKGLSTNDYDDTAKAAVDGLSTALNGKVDKVNGKGLSTNDYDDTEKAKVAAAVTKAVNDLTNYYLKTETYSKTEVDNIAAAIKNSRFEVVSTLPTSDIHTNVIYLVPKASAQTNNAKDEYINLDGTTAGWEKIGDTEIDLSGYVTTTALNTALADYTTTADLTTLLAGYIQKSNTAGLVKNDGSIDETSYATAASVTAITDGTTIDSFSDVETALSGKTDKVSGATNGNFAGLDANGNLTDSGKKASDFATPENVQDSINTSADLLKDTVGWTGKNLLPYPYITTTKTSGGMTYTENGDGSVTANADSATSSTSSFIFYRFRESTLPKGKYIVTDEGASETNVYLALNKENDKGEYVADLTRLGFNGLHEVEFTVDYDGYTQFSVMIYARSGVTADNLKFYPMIRKANITDSTYEPYHESVETMYEEEIHGINLFNAEPFTKTNNDITITFADNIVTLNGTPSANVGFTLRDFRSSDLVDGETYIISDDNASNYSNCYIYINGEKYDGSTVYDVVRLQTKATLKTDFSTYRRYLIGVYIRTEAGTLSNKKFNIMIRKADIENSTYHPYNEQAIQNQINVQGVLGAKNLLPQVEHANTTMIINGVTITSREDGSVLLNGTSTAAVSYHFIRLSSDTNRKFIKQVAGKKVTISGTNVLNTNARVQFWSTTTNVIGDTTGNGTTFTIPSDLATTDDYNFAIWIPSGSTIDNIIVYPMLRLASDPDNTYVPYAKTNQQLTYEGPVLKSYPVEWNEDLNVGTDKGGSIIQYGKLYFVTYWFKATTALTGNVGIIKLPKNGLTGGNYVITEGNDKAIWGGKATKDGVDYVSISCTMIVDKVYRAQCVWMDFT